MRYARAARSLLTLSPRRRALAVVRPPAPAAAAPQLMPVTSRNYAIDLYDGNALGNSATVAMGGAAAANAIGSSGTLINVSAPAVRPTTDVDPWSWDYHLDYLNAQVSSDYTNSGLPQSSTFTGSSSFTGGLSLRVRDWAGAFTGYQQSVQVGTVATSAGSGTPLDAQTLRLKFAVAKWEPRIDTALGLALDVAQFQLKPNCSMSDCGSLFTISGGGLEAGAQWIPRLESFRVGAGIATPIQGGNVNANSCAGMEDNCN